MVDTISCLSVEDLTVEFFEKLLLGAIDKAVDHQAIASPRGAEIVANGQETVLPYTPPLQQGVQAENIHQQYVPTSEQYRQSSLAERNFNSQARTWYNLQAGQASASVSQTVLGSSPRLEQYNQQPTDSLPRQSTLPQTSAELPYHPASRTRTFGGAMKKSGFKPLFG